VQDERFEFFEPLMSYIRKKPSDFPDQENRKKRKLPELPLAQEEPKTKKPPTKEELKAQAKADRSTINFLRLILGPMMKELKGPQWRIFRSSIIPDRDIDYLLREQDPNIITSNLSPEEQMRQGIDRPYEIALDKYGNRGLKEKGTGRFFYNLNLQIIEQRLSNGYYKRAKEFLWDIKTIVKDAAANGNPDTIMKANNMHGYAMAEAELIEVNNHQLFLQCEAVYAREQARAKLAAESQPAQAINMAPPAPTTSIHTGPIILGEPVPPRQQPNGEHAHTNGATVPSNATGLGLTHDPDASSGERAQFPPGLTETPSNRDTVPEAAAERSQRSALEKMVPGSQAADYDNNASTTTSGHKTSGRPSGESGAAVTVNVNVNVLQQSNGDRAVATQPDSYPFSVPDFTSYIPAADTGSELPDTQSTESNGVPPAAALKVRKSVSLPSSGGSGDSQQDSLGSDGIFKHPGPPPHRANSGPQGLEGPAEMRVLQEQRMRQAHLASTGPSQPSQPLQLSPTSPTGAGAPDTGLATAPPTSPPAPPLAAPQAQQPQQQQQRDGQGRGWSDAYDSPKSSGPPSPRTPTPPPLLVDERALTALRDRILARTEGLTVEQLEMVDARCMDAVWRGRAEWDRTRVATAVEEGLREVLEDVAWQHGLGDGMDLDDGRFASFAD
jgi:hypothetical protein